MIDNIIVATIVVVAAIYIGRKLVKQFTSTEAGCNCSGCGQAGSCSSQNRNGQLNCNGPR